MKIPSTVILLISLVQARRERRAVFDLIKNSQKNPITHEDPITNTNLVVSKVLQRDTEITFEYLRSLLSKELRGRKERRRNKNKKEGIKKQFLERQQGNRKPQLQKQNKQHSTLNFSFLTKYFRINWLFLPRSESQTPEATKQ